MTIKVTVNSVPTTRVSINEQKRDEIRTVGLSPAATQNFLVSLNDVDSSSLNNNDVPVWSSSANKFVTKPVPVIDGGGF